ncbi:bifunctional 5,10-methylenetetrahydrofolate dehydrogenase/5,10-methenyltetrahydrofolate cyclohydrolase [Clostridium frigidicarnis]|uniref:Bifunctional protein FolD n=1 Tax=Clostridium frigidicarnis TaxID=84698 RepID=A0A1I0WG17_9CLOT|nr:tetrahydrofolate dehydrogenase/cyclohydrolase catalytic domain-containing protein [Clostridium frigidicarnis]SFA87682.1 methylenetetrahydrofolate dehydrogenase (NADP+) / methenyltetrahydrofolate cyclohydrolase [Clostridium frigidicarnis]
MGDIINGKILAEDFKQKIKAQIDEAVSKGYRVPCLATIVVGNDGGSIYYANNQKKLCDKLGLKNRSIFLEETIDEKDLILLIKELNEDNTVDGIMLQVPLPKNLNEEEITNLISPYKDVDGLTDFNNGKFYKGKKAFVPCTPRSVMHLIKSTGMDISGKNAVVIGRSNIVGKPVTQLLLNENATVTVCHSRTKDLKSVCKNADILVVAMGKPKFIDDSYIKEGAVVIDVGTSSVDGKICGDVDFDKVINIASHLTPVPGGVGSVTTTLLIKNTCEAWEKNVY